MVFGFNLKKEKYIFVRLPVTRNDSIFHCFHIVVINVAYVLIQIGILIQVGLPTLPMLYLPFNVYLDSKRVSILIEAVFANITNVVPSLQCIS